MYVAHVLPEELLLPSGYFHAKWLLHAQKPEHKTRLGLFQGGQETLLCRKTGRMFPSSFGIPCQQGHSRREQKVDSTCMVGNERNASL